MRLGIFPELKSPLPCKWILMLCSSSLFPCFQYPGSVENGCYSIIYFHSKRDTILWILVIQFLKNNVDHELPRSFRERGRVRYRAGGPRVEGIDLPTYVLSQQVSMEWHDCCRALGHDLLSVRGDVLVVPHVGSLNSNLEGWMISNLSCCSGGMLILM